MPRGTCYLARSPCEISVVGWLVGISLCVHLQPCCAGHNIINLDSASWSAIVGRDRPALVRFDKDYSSGEKADAFKKLAAAAKGQSILICNVGVSAYGKKVNQDLAEKYGYKKKDRELVYADMDGIFPKFRFFPGGKKKSKEYKGEVTFAGLAAWLLKVANIDIAAVVTGAIDGMSLSRGRPQRNVVSLNYETFPLLIGRQLPAFVRFDKEYPSGSANEEFEKLAESMAGAELIIAGVGVSSHGDKHNYELAEAYGYKEKEKDVDRLHMDKSFPRFRFFPANGGKDVPYTGESTSAAMTRFLKAEAGVYRGLPGGLQAFDLLASEFVKATDKKDVISRAKAAADAVPQEEKAAAAYYVRHMEFALDKGNEWFKTEHSRIKWMLDNAKYLIDWQREELELKANRLSAFVDEL